MLARSVGEQLVITGVAGAEHDQLRAAVDNVRQYRRQEVQTLVVRQPRHHAQQGRAGLHRQPKLALQRGLVLRARRHVPQAEVGRQVWIGGGVEGDRVDAVEDAGDAVLALPEQRVQPLPVGRRQDLPGIGGADGVDGVRIANAAGEQNQPRR